MAKWQVDSFCAWFGMMLAVLVAPSLVSAADKPNIVFILADDLGYTDLACYGSRYYETPNIERMAAEGMRFTQGYTCGPNCQPTRAALMSGQYGPRTGVYTVGSIDRFNWQTRPLRPVDNRTELAPEKLTIAEVLKANGYATGMFGKWHLGEDKPGSGADPMSQGFDEAIVSAGRHFDFRTHPRVDYPPETYLADFLTDRAVDFIQRHKDEAFFLYLPHYAVHSPHQAKKEGIAHFQGKSPVGGHNDPVYAAMIASVDESVGRVRKTLDELGLTEKTLVIFSSDNGGVGGYERAGVKKNKSITDNAPLRGGKGMLYEGGIRVPYIFAWKGRIQSGQICDVPINSVDLFPTLMAIAGAQVAASDVLDGTSYSDILLGQPSNQQRNPLYWHFPGYLGAGQGSWRTTPVSVIREGDWKLMEFLEDGRIELYNVADDVGEERNLADARPENVRDLQGKLVAWRKAIDAPMPTANDLFKESAGFHPARGPRVPGRLRVAASQAGEPHGQASRLAAIQ